MREIAVIFNKPWETFDIAVMVTDVFRMRHSTTQHLPNNRSVSSLLHIVPSSMLMGNGTVS